MRLMSGENAQPSEGQGNGPPTLNLLIVGALAKNREPTNQLGEVDKVVLVLVKEAEEPLRNQVVLRSNGAKAKVKGLLINPTLTVVNGGQGLELLIKSLDLILANLKYGENKGAGENPLTVTEGASKGTPPYMKSSSGALKPSHLRGSQGHSPFLPGTAGRPETFWGWQAGEVGF